MATTTSRYQPSGLSTDEANRINQLLQGRLTALIDLELTLKHIHWNVVGPTFIGVHQMIDPQVDAVRLMVDAVAERIATMGGMPVGTPGFVAENRSWDDYSILRASTMEHLGALDVVYSGVVKEHRAAIKELDELDLVTQDMLIGQLEQLEEFQWFVRAHLETNDGTIPSASTEAEGAAAGKERMASAGSNGG
jgi:starvation-inducible DNA-binding protein